MEKRKVQKKEKGAVTRGSRSKDKARKKKVILPVNTRIRTSNDRSWCVVAHIGSGGFGDVYKVIDENQQGFECAMKTEMSEAQPRRLTIERSILKEIDQYTKVNKKTRHFCELIDSGLTKDYSWVAMTLIGPSLDIVRRLLNRQFTKMCVVNMALQVLDAVEVMHEVGFIHRDLKPGNICTGVPPNDDHVLYVLDFGISRRIFKNGNSRELRNKRERVPFYGTRKFCNRACHLEMDQGRKDDMETYVYTILDLFHNERGLPWSRNLQSPGKIVEKKKALFVNPTKELDPSIPAPIARIIVYLGPLKFEDPVDYRLIETEIRSIRVDTRNSEPSEDTMDWTGKLEALLKKLAKKMETPKGEETLMLERMQNKRKINALSTTKGGDTVLNTKEGEASEGFHGMTTQATGKADLAPPPTPKSKKPEKMGKSRSKNIA